MLRNNIINEMSLATYRAIAPHRDREWAQIEHSAIELLVVVVFSEKE